MPHQRKSPRWKEYDYTSPGGYFVTICTKDRRHYFGEITNGEMILSEIGILCEQELEIMLDKRPSVDMHEYVIMPNHVHLLFIVNECRDMGLPCQINKPIKDNRRDMGLPCQIKDDASIRPYKSGIITNQSLGSIIGGRKSAVTKQCNQKNITFARQSRYHDHVIRNEQEYAPQEVPLWDNRIKHYIQTNPQNRENDSLLS